MIPKISFFLHKINLEENNLVRKVRLYKYLTRPESRDFTIVAFLTLKVSGLMGAVAVNYCRVRPLVNYPELLN